MVKHKGVGFEIYECPKWAVNCSMCPFETATSTKREAEYWIKRHINEQHPPKKVKSAARANEVCEYRVKGWHCNCLDISEPCCFCGLTSETPPKEASIFEPPIKVCVGVMGMNG